MVEHDMSTFWDFLPPPDGRTKHLFLIGSVYSLPTIYAFYLLIIYKIAPALMKNRPAFDLKQLLVAFNMLQVLLNSLLVILSVPLWPHINMVCGPVDKSLNPVAVLPTRLGYGYFLLKLLDLVETLFFVLRKKDNQVSTLHVYHHVSMVFAGWMGARYFPGGQFMYILVVNSAVHVVMYSYYLLSIWDPTYKTSLWWKKHLTQLQIGHQVFLLSTIAGPLLKKDCPVPKWPCYVLLGNGSVIVSMFVNFYLKTYVLNQKPSREEKSN